MRICNGPSLIRIGCASLLGRLCLRTQVIIVILFSLVGLPEAAEGDWEVYVPQDFTDDWDVYVARDFTGDWDVCIDKKLAKRAVAGCTKIITAAREPKEHIAVAYYNRGLAYANLAMFEKALSDYSDAIARDPTFAMAYYDRGLARYALGDAKSALVDYTLAITLKPDFADALGNRGVAYLVLGTYDLALVDLDKAIALDTKNGVNFFNRADIYEKMGRWVKATPDWERAVALLSATNRWRKTAQDRLAINKETIAKQRKANAPQ